MRSNPAIQTAAIPPKPIPVCSPGLRTFESVCEESGGGTGKVPFEEEEVGVGETEGSALRCGSRLAVAVLDG